MFGTNHLGVIDYIVVGGTLLFSMLVGLYYGFRGEQTKEAMLVGGRNMKMLPTAISMLVTYFSASSILGFPGEVYSYGIQAYVLILLVPIFVTLSSLVFVRFFYEMQLTSIYEYLELRFESRWPRWLASFTFILQILLMNSVTLFAPAIALKAIVGIPVWLTIFGIGVIGSIYTSIGGLKGVILTDCLQFVFIVVGMVAIVSKGLIKAGGVVRAFEKAGEMGRLNLFDFSVDPFMRHNLLNFVLGYGFSQFVLGGTNQPLFQRYSSLPTAKAAVRSLWLMVPLTFVSWTAVVLAGISAVATYASCCPILLGKIKKADAIIPYFVIEELAFPGMIGIFVSLIFSAVLSTISSNLNSLAAVTWEDFLSLHPSFKNLKPSHQANWTKILTAIYGTLTICIAYEGKELGSLYQLMGIVVQATAGALGGVIISGMFITFMNKHGAVAGILSGLGSMAYIAINSFYLGKTYKLNPKLPTYLTDCPEGTNFSKATNFTLTPVPELDYPEKFFTLSYLLYAVVGAVITISVGCLVSIITGGLSKSHQVDKKYLHPCVRSFVKEEKCVKICCYNDNGYRQNGANLKLIPDSSSLDSFPCKYNDVIKNNRNEFK